MLSAPAFLSPHRRDGAASFSLSRGIPCGPTAVLSAARATTTRRRGLTWPLPGCSRMEVGCHPSAAVLVPSAPAPAPLRPSGPRVARRAPRVAQHRPPGVPRVSVDPSTVGAPTPSSTRTPRSRRPPPASVALPSRSATSRRVQLARRLRGLLPQRSGRLESLVRIYKSQTLVDRRGAPSGPDAPLLLPPRHSPARTRAATPLLRFVALPPARVAPSAPSLSPPSQLRLARLPPRRNACRASLRATRPCATASSSRSRRRSATGSAPPSRRLEGRSSTPSRTRTRGSSGVGASTLPACSPGP